MFYYSIVCLGIIIIGLVKTDLALAVEDVTEFFEKKDQITTRRELRGYNYKEKLSTKPLESLSFISETKRIGLKSDSSNNAYSNQFNDLYWRFQWFAHDQRVSPGPVMDHNLVPAYNAGYTGKGVVVGVIGDGVQRYLDDLINLKGIDFEEDASIRFQKDPDVNKEGKKAEEGTMMAGVIAMTANNQKCGVGVAYDAEIVGLKVAKDKSTKVYDYKFGQAMTFDMYKGASAFGTLCDIYAFAIGRPDDGMFMAHPFLKKDIQKAFKKGLEKGRKGKGSIYVVGAGDGKTDGEDNCGADDLVNDPHAVVVASADHRGRTTPYSERCAAVMATAYSSGDDEAIVATNVDGSCSKYYSGNSPSVAIAAGILALALEAKSELTARDVQHLIVSTSEVAPLVENKGTWKENGAGFYFSHDFGFGLLNAENMVTAASKWISMPPELVTEEVFMFSNPVLTVGSSSEGIVVPMSQMRYVEVVELICNVKLLYRGTITMNLKSPSGTEVVMLERRPRDRDTSGLSNWRLKTPFFWGEYPTGIWTLTASIVQFSEDEQSCGLSGIIKYLVQSVGPANKIKKVTLVVRGTKEKPHHYKSDIRARTYSAFYSKELHGLDRYAIG